MWASSPPNCFYEQWYHKVAGGNTSILDLQKLGKQI